MSQIEIRSFASNNDAHPVVIALTRYGRVSEADMPADLAERLRSFGPGDENSDGLKAAMAEATEIARLKQQIA